MLPKLKEGVSIHEATHVRTRNGVIERIVKKHGIGPNGELAPPSKGGFSVTTERGHTVSMWDARCYFKEEEDDGKIQDGETQRRGQIV